MKTRRNFYILLIVCPLLIVFNLMPLYSQAHDIGRGETAAAELYVQWAENAIQEGRWEHALALLERGDDYENVSSDLSYLLARARIQLEKPRGAILDALRRALAANRWNNYVPEQARLLEAEQLIVLKSYQEALNTLTFTGDSPQASSLRMLALRLIPRNDEFIRFTMETLYRFPMETEPVRIFLDYLKIEEAKGNMPRQTERAILDLIISRLPVLIQEDGELIWMAVPFMRDTLEAARLIAAYRASYEPLPASIPVALNLGVISERAAMEELFSPENTSSGLDISLLDDVWDLLRNEESRILFRNFLGNYTGIISMDFNNDRIPEAHAVYQNGMLISYSYNENQDRLPELVVHFRAGEPHY